MPPNKYLPMIPSEPLEGDSNQPQVGTEKDWLGYPSYKYSPLVDAIRAKYPGAYDDISDNDLEEAWLTKYPGAYDDLSKKNQPGVLSKIWNKPELWKSIAPDQSPEQLAIQQRFRERHPYAAIPFDKLQGFIDFLGSPAGMGMTASSALSVPAAAAGYGLTATGLALPGVLGAVGMAKGGLEEMYHGYQEGSGPKMVSGAIDVGLGALGTYGGYHEIGKLRDTAAARVAEDTKYNPKWGPVKKNAQGLYGDTGQPYGPFKPPNWTQPHGPWPESPFSPEQANVINPRVRGLLPPPTRVSGPGGTAIPYEYYPVFGERPPNAPEATSQFPNTTGMGAPTDNMFPGSYLADKGTPFGTTEAPTSDTLETGTQHGPFEASAFSPELNEAPWHTANLVPPNRELPAAASGSQRFTAGAGGIAERGRFYPTGSLGVEAPNAPPGMLPGEVLAGRPDLLPQTPHQLPAGPDTIPDTQRLIDPNAATRPSTSLYENVPTTDQIPVKSAAKTIEDILKSGMDNFVGSKSAEALNKLKEFFTDRSGAMDPERYLEIIRSMMPDEESAQRVFEAIKTAGMAGRGKYESLPNTPTKAQFNLGIDEPQFQRVPRAGRPGNMDYIAMGGATPKVLKTLGSSLYAGDRPSVITKELIQNFSDEHREIGQTNFGDVVFHNDIKDPLGNDAKAITVRDNGRGMTPEQLYTKFTDVGETGKAGVASASGGFGFAKAAPLLSGTYARVESVVMEGGKKVKYSFEGTPNQLNKDPVEGVPLNREVLPKGDDTKTGVKVTTYLPKDTPLYDAKEFAKHMVENSPGMNSPVRITNHYGWSDPIDWIDKENGAPKSWAASSTDTVNPQPAKKFQDTVSTPGADIHIHYDDPVNTTENQYKLHVLNKGLYQKTLSGHYGQEFDNVPANIVADIVAKVEEGETGYPFGANREQIDSSVTKAINQWVDDNIKSGAQRNKIDRIRGLYNAMPSFNVPGTSLPSVLFDSGNRLTPQELTHFQNSPVIQGYVRILDRMVGEIISKPGNEALKDRLEKTGLLLSESKTTGIHIPNIDTGKSTLLGNPLPIIERQANAYQAAVEQAVTGIHEVAHIGKDNPYAIINPADYTTPETLPFFQAFLNEMREQGGISAGHGIEFLNRLAKAFVDLGADRMASYAKEFQANFTDATGGYSPETQKLLQIYKDSRGRSSTTTDFLSSTGVPQESGPGGESGIIWNDQSNAAGATAESTAAARESAAAIRDAARTAAAAERLLSTLAEGGRTYAGIDELTAAAQNRGRLLDPRDIQALMKGITNSDLSPGKQLSAKMAMQRILAGKTPYASDMNLIRQVYGDEFADGIIQAKGQQRFDYPTVRNAVTDGVNTTKALMASLNLHAPLRQGLPLIFSKAYRSAFADMLHMYTSQEVYDGTMRSIEEHPMFELAKENGVKFTDLSEDLARREEEFISKWAGELPWVKGASRAYTGFLNKLRMDFFADKAQMMIDNGSATPDALRSLGEYTNNATGRGSLGALEKNAVGMNALFFSPRTVASRIRMYNLLNPLSEASIFRETNPVVRQAKIKGILTMGAWTLGTVLTAKMAGAKVSDDPTSPDFGKFHMGNMRIDPYGGFQQYAVFGARLLNGLAKGEDVMPTVGRFAENKLSPVAAFIADIMLGKSAYRPDKAGHDISEYMRQQTGNKYLFNDNTARVINDVLPMTLNDLYEVAKDDPNLIPIALLPATFGATVTDYKPTQRGFHIPTKPSVPRMPAR